MKVKALKTDYWSARDSKGGIVTGSIEHKKNEVYEVISTTTISSDLDPAYLIKVNEKYGAIKVKDCEIVEGSLDDLNNNIVEHNINLIL